MQISSAPAELALGLVDLVVVDRGVPLLHQAVLVELPRLIPVTSPSSPLGVVALVLEADRDAVLREAPEVLLQPVVQLALPLTPQELLDGLGSLEEL